MNVRMKLGLWLLVLGMGLAFLSGVAVGADPMEELKEKGVPFTHYEFGRAIRRNQMGVVELFLDAGMKVNIRFQGGATPLHLAMSNVKGTRTAHLLICRGADVNAQDDHGITPLMDAARRGNVEMMRLLIDDCADMGLTDKEGWTALKHARKKKRTDAVALLEKAQQGGKAAACSASVFVNHARHGELEAVKRFVAAGMDVNVRGDGRIALIEAVEHRNLEMVRFLLKNNASPNIYDSSGWTPFLSAVQLGNRKIVELLIEKGASLEAKERATNKLGYQTALLVAAEKNNHELIRLLVEKGADPNAQNRSFSGVWDILHLDDPQARDTVKILAKHGANLTPALTRAASNGYLEMMQIALENGADVNAQDIRGSIAIIEVVRNKDYESVKYLLDRGADVNAQNGGGETALDITENRYWQVYMSSEEAQATEKTLALLHEAGARRSQRPISSEEARKEIKVAPSGTENLRSFLAKWKRLDHPTWITEKELGKAEVADGDNKFFIGNDMFQLFEADLNNDGARDYALVSFGGTSRIGSIHEVYTDEKAGLKALGFEETAEKQDARFGQHFDFSHITVEDGTTYMHFEGMKGAVKFKWERDALRPID